ncbi:hypothetical protein RJ639_011731 [Escallonia herrerae]|uniref:Uncharacterized protein n=1 Tax=Escallonia herrerae TaxID=1293975 RepID=A0AA88VML3_9ASTE|nr:hypothetical protein RJ639_011731 [Escallonia herrerae]
MVLIQAMAGRSEGSETYPPNLTARAEVQSHGLADPPVSSSEEGGRGDEKEYGTPTGAAEGPVSRKLMKHHSGDKSVAGGGVIIGGLVTAIFAAVYCYIRVTRRNDGGRALSVIASQSNSKC